jgi:hypothetical protein
MNQQMTEIAGRKLRFGALAPDAAGAQPGAITRRPRLT